MLCMWKEAQLRNKFQGRVGGGCALQQKILVASVYTV